MRTLKCKNKVTLICSKKSPDRELEVEIAEYIDWVNKEWGMCDLTEAQDALKTTARHFVQWAEERMLESILKNTVDANVIKDMNGGFHIRTDCVDGEKYKFGEWVKALIIKDGE